MKISNKEKIIIVGIAVVVVAICTIYIFSQRNLAVLSADEQVISQGTIGGNRYVRIGVMWAYNGEAGLGIYDEIKLVELPSKTVKRGDMFQVGNYRIEIKGVSRSLVKIKMTNVENEEYQFLTHEYIVENTQGEVEKLRIGVGNIWEEEYTSDEGESKKEMTAGLWVFYRNQKSLDKQITVYIGKSFDVGEYRIKVINIKEGSGSLSSDSVSLDIFKKNNFL